MDLIQEIDLIVLNSIIKSTYLSETKAVPFASTQAMYESAVSPNL